jgi:RimJ/RimL family protein N-acetyltransferase
MITTERLIIRPFQKTDYQDLYEYLSLKEIYKYEPGEPVSLEEAKKLSMERAGGHNFWAATLKENKKLIGHVSFIQTEPKHFLTWEIGYIFSPKYQNKGYATEASRAVINYAFKKLGTHRIVAYCSQDNPASWKVLEKCGMRKEGSFKKNVYFHLDENRKPKWFDSYQYALLCEEFNEKR